MKLTGHQFSHLLLTLTAIGSMAMGAFLMSTLIARPLQAANQWKQDISLTQNSGKIMEKRVQIDNFTKVKAGYAIEVVYTQGQATGEAIVNGPKAWLDNIDITTNNEQLTIGCHSGADEISGKITVTIVAPEINKLDIASAASFTATGPVAFSQPLTIDASSAADISFGEMLLPSLNISTQSAASVYVLSVDSDDITINASSASTVKLKGMSSPFVKANASSAADIIISGRCNKSEITNSSGGEVRTRGLIRESMPITPRRKSLKL